MKATQIVHWPSGPVVCCDEHAKQLIHLGGFLGSHVVTTPYEGDAECGNCANEKKKAEEAS